jgi:hypothetical protein
VHAGISRLIALSERSRVGSCVISQWLLGNHREAASYVASVLLIDAPPGLLL